MQKTRSPETKISIIKEIAGVITSTSNLDSITNLILDLALGYTKAVSGSILLLDKRGDLTISAARGIDPELIQAIRVKLGDYICGKVAKEKTPLLVRDIANFQQAGHNMSHKYKTKSFICCPILIKDRLMGVININDKSSGGPFTKDDLNLINILSNLTAVALEQARLVSEMRSKALELDERSKGLIDTDRLKTEFIARMTHELRTPLNSIKGAVYYLKDKKPTNSKQAGFVDIIYDETTNVINLLDSLLNFSDLEYKEVHLKKKIIHLKEILEEATSAGIIQNTLSNNKITINMLSPDTFPDIIGEKIRLLQSIIHIIDSITDYAKPDDIIDIESSKTSSDARVDFILRNRKIPEEEISIIFDERSLWYGMDINKNKMKFYLAKKTIETHDGIISASNGPKGFAVSISLPANTKEYINVKINELLDSMLSFAAGAMNLNKCSVMLVDDKTGKLAIRSAIGMDEAIMKNTSIDLGENIAGSVAEKNKPLLLEDIEKDTVFGKKNLPQYNNASLLCLPIIVKGKAIGVINLNNKMNGECFNKKDFYIALAVTERISSIIETIQNSETTDQEFGVLAKEIESLSLAENKYSKRNEQTTSLVYEIMHKMEQNEEMIKSALYSSRLYDLGLTQIDENILAKKSALSDIEKKIIKTHPFPGARLVGTIESGNTVMESILHHHEKYDGTGYPDGLKGKNIPFISRILSIVDTYTAMTTERPYRKAHSKKTALTQIKADSGKHFDPGIVNVFTQLV